MTSFLILAPYAAYTALMLLASTMTSLMAAIIVSGAMIALDMLRGRSIKLLGVGTIVVFATITSYLAFIDPTTSNTAVKLAVDGGMLAISAGSILIRRPFTLQYAIELVPAETARLTGFVRANYIITAAWTGAILMMMIGNAMVAFVPWLPFWTGLAVAFAARNSAIFFTKWYPQYRMLKYARSMSDMAAATK